MSSFLQEIITDENLIWGKSLENNPEKFVVKLTSRTINELKRNRKELKNLDESCFPELKNEISKLKITKILRGVGFLIIDGKSFLDFSKNEILKIYEMVCGMQGTLYVQNINSCWVDVGLGWSTLRTEYTSDISELAATRTCSSV